MRFITANRSSSDNTHEGRVVLKTWPNGIPNEYVNHGTPMSLKSNFLVNTRLNQEVLHYKFRSDSLPGILLAKDIRHQLTHYENCSQNTTLPVALLGPNPQSDGDLDIWINRNKISLDMVKCQALRYICIPAFSHPVGVFSPTRGIVIGEPIPKNISANCLNTSNPYSAPPN